MAACHRWPLRTPPPLTGGPAARWQRRQEVSDWVTLNKHWQLPDGWPWFTSVPYISAVRDLQPVSQHSLLLRHSFFFLPLLMLLRALTLLLSVYVPWLCPCVCNLQTNMSCSVWFFFKAVHNRYLIKNIIQRKSLLIFIGLWIKNLRWRRRVWGVINQIPQSFLFHSKQRFSETHLLTRRPLRSLWMEERQKKKWKWKKERNKKSPCQMK